MSEAKIKTIITPGKRWFDFRLGELFRCRDLVTLFVRRTFVAQYKQTILGWPRLAYNCGCTRRRWHTPPA